MINLGFFNLNKFSYGIGTMLLSYVFSICEKDPLVKSVYLHVQVKFIKIKFYFFLF